MLIGHVNLLAKTGTTVQVPYHTAQVTAIHLKIGYQQISSIGTWIQMSCSDFNKKDWVPEW